MTMMVNVADSGTFERRGWTRGYSWFSASPCQTTAILSDTCQRREMMVYLPYEEAMNETQEANCVLEAVGSNLAECVQQVGSSCIL